MSQVEAKPAQTAQLDPEQFLDIASGARFLCVSEVSIRRYLTRKKLRRYKVGSRTLVKVADLMALVQEVK